MTTRFRRVTQREGLLFHGPYGWAEAAPFWDYSPGESSIWLRSALRSALEPAPSVLRDSVPVNVTIPVTSAEDGAARVRDSGGCATAKVKVADPGVDSAFDCARVEAVAEALFATVGERARLRVDVNGAWDVDEAIQNIRDLNTAAQTIGGLEYVEQPCVAVDDLAAVRVAVDVPIAADESIRRSSDPLAVARAGAADIAVIKVAPLGGVDRAVKIAQDTGLTVVVSSALETSVGLAQGVHAAAALPELPYACGLATSQLLASDITASPLLPEDGIIRLREVIPDETLINSERLPEGVYENWLGRLSAMCDVVEA
ncbi:MAG: O-succinylbenzoate synthase [Actinobacteria bacterium]|nr:MAG: O-succinylbenzoate synthase [Actinomycetota bacterium]